MTTTAAAIDRRANHHCHAIGCSTACKPEFLMCPKHWKMVPGVLQRAVYAAYRPGQCDDMRVSGAWWIAAERAIVAVAVFEKRLTPAQAQAQVERAVQTAKSLDGKASLREVAAELASDNVRAATVVNRNTEPFDVYIGRGSPFGNPYSHVASQHRTIVVATRDEAIRRYKRWLLGEETVAWMRPPTRDQVLALRGKRLGCYCRPLSCHGDVLVELIEEHDAHVAENEADAQPAPAVETTGVSAQGVRRRDGHGLAFDDEERLAVEASVRLREAAERRAIAAAPPDDAAPDVEADADDGATVLSPFLKWVGGKRWAIDLLVPRIAAALVPGATYVEPFLGAGAIALAMPAGTPMELGDYCAPLMGLWWWIKHDVERLVEVIPPGLRDELRYYETRARFNARMFDVEDPLPSALFLWLNFMCFNGVYRENAAGEFNVPFGKGRKVVRLPNERQLRRVHEHLQSAKLYIGADFSFTVQCAEDGDVLFADPPYDGVFTDYTADGFGPGEQRRLAESLELARRRGVTILETNADTPLIRELYAGDGWTIENLEEPRAVAAKGTSRTKAACVLITGTP
ncbi:MAG TPA: Dam family site-specific DNA-(adenine-N6)-methyltransferase [Acidimicrobiales bacterium]